MKDPMQRPPRKYEDIEVGERRVSSIREVTEADILRFAREYDPQWFHCDSEAAKQSAFGELIGSGLHSAVLWRQLDHEVNSDIDYVCGLGWDKVRWRKPLKVGSRVFATSEVLSKRPSESRDDRGVVITRCALCDEAEGELMTFDSSALVYTRAADPAA